MTRVVPLVLAALGAIAGCAGAPSEQERTAAQRAGLPAPDPAAERIGRAFAYARTGDTTAMTQTLTPDFDVDVRNDRGDTLLILASYADHTETALLLLERGAGADERSADGMSALTAAAFRGNLVLMRALLDRGVAVDPRGNSGRTPLLWAAFGGSDAAVDLLLERGAAITARDKNGQGAAELAASQGHTALAERLAKLAAGR